MYLSGKAAKTVLHTVIYNSPPPGNLRFATRLPARAEVEKSGGSSATEAGKREKRTVRRRGLQALGCQSCALCILVVISLKTRELNALDGADYPTLNMTERWCGCPRHHVHRINNGDWRMRSILKEAGSKGRSVIVNDNNSKVMGIVNLPHWWNC